MARVLHVISGLKVGGAEMALLRLAAGSQQSGYHHTIVSLTPDGDMRRRYHDAGIEVVGLDFKRAPIRNFLLLVSMIRKNRPDIIQTWMYHADLLGGLAARFAGNRNVIWGIRSTAIPAGGARLTKIVRRVCGWLSYSLPRFIVCVAEASRRAHVAVGYDAARMIVVQNGFEPADFVVAESRRGELRTDCEFPSGSVVVGTLGRFNPAKDHENFVRAAGLVAHAHPHARFLMVGRGLDAANTELATWIARTGHADRFVLLGERSDVPACLAAMDIFCLSSRTEGFPNVVGEAMLMGVPCVVTDVGDAAMLVADTGLVVPMEDSQSLGDGLSRLIAMSLEARSDLGEKASKRINEEFGIGRVRGRFEALYRQIISQEKGSC